MNQAEKIQQIVSRYGKTYVVLSFGSADGGAMFGQWLREEIMKQKNYTQPNNVYLDTFGLDNVPGTKHEMKLIRPTAGGLASLNEAWDEYYRYAVSTAHIMIFVATAAWYNSSYCRRELEDHFFNENQNRFQKGERPLSGVVLTFPDSRRYCKYYDFERMGMTVIPTTKSYVVADEKKRLKLTGHYRDFWIVNQETLQKVVQAIN